MGLLILIALFLYFTNSKNTAVVTRQEEKAAEKKVSYSEMSEAQKGRLYLDHRISVVLKNKFPSLVTWNYVSKGISGGDDMIYCEVQLPEETKYIWVKRKEILGDFHLEKEALDEELLDYENIPVIIKEWIVKNLDKVKADISESLTMKRKFLSVSLSEQTTEQRNAITEYLSNTLDGIMVELKNDTVVLNMQNLLTY